jgi:citrate lyase subunit beta/citryl-CoA lyase
MTTRLRSWMFVPGNRRRFIDKALNEAQPDAIYLDLEDGVPPQEKALARTQVAEALARPTTGVVRYVRVNRAGSDWWRQDVEAVLVPGIDGVCLPKVEDEDEVHAMHAELERFEREAGVPGGHVRILLAVESALGLLRAPALAACHERVSGLMFGAEDFALDLGLGTRREAEAGELVYARSSLVVAAASAKVMSVDGVFPDLDDEDGLWADVRQARRLGFSGKSTFHPKQMQVINEVFTPSADELDYARRVVTAFEEAQARGDGAVAVGGQLVDLPIVVRAQLLLESTAEPH